ncbi:hypothetical protein [Haloplanus salilacus]|uniref:hypothetical protein n=1 Tax=Haloplanus salilacus TaxID=2949994 RepID=UPI0030D04C63
MLDRLRDLLRIREDTDDDGTGVLVVEVPEEPPDEAALVEDFDRMLDIEGITVDGDRADVVETFGDVVAQYGTLVPALRALGERVGDDGVANVNCVLDKDEIAEWREEHPEAVATIESTTEGISAAFERIETTDAMPDNEVPASVETFVQRVRSLGMLTETED